MALTLQVFLLQASDTAGGDIPVYSIAICAVVLLLMLFLGGIAAGAEVALFTLNAKDVNYLKTRDDNSSIQIVELIEKPSTLLSTLRSTKVSCAVIIVLSSIYLGRLLLSESMDTWLIWVLVFVFNFILIAVIIEILPKVYARQNNVRMAMFTVPFVSLVYSFFKNFVPAEELDTEMMDRDSKKRSNSLSDDELKEAVALRLGDNPSKEELDIFRGIMKFGEITVKQVMQPRMNISGIREQWDIRKVREKVISARFSRMPVYTETIDQIIGMLYTKDLVEYLNDDHTDWHSLIRPVFYIHEGKLIEDLFQEFQNRRVHAAIVVDEFGGTSGLVTLEDIMEEIVGEIRDEFDEDVLNFKKMDDQTYIFDGKTLINEMCRILGVSYETFDDAKGESASVAGLILEVAGKIPVVNDKVIIDNFQFTIMAVDKLHIERVKVKIVS